MLYPYGTPGDGDVASYEASTGRTVWANLQAQFDALQAQIDALGTGGGGVPDPGLSPAYTNTYGWGDRSADVSVLIGGQALGNFSGPWGSTLVDAAYAGQESYLPINADGTGLWIRFDFPVPVLITEARVYTSYTLGAKSFGTWQWEGSNNKINWTAIGSSFALDLTVGRATNTGGGGVPGNGYDYSPFTRLSGNGFLWLSYRLHCVSGTWGARSESLREFEFKIAS